MTRSVGKVGYVIQWMVLTLENSNRCYKLKMKHQRLEMAVVLLDVVLQIRWLVIVSAGWKITERE